MDEKNLAHIRAVWDSMDKSNDSRNDILVCLSIDESGEEFTVSLNDYNRLQELARKTKYSMVEIIGSLNLDRVMHDVEGGL